MRPSKRDCMVAAKIGPDLRLVSLNWWELVTLSQAENLELNGIPEKILAETTVCSQWIAILVDPDDHLM